MLLPPVGILLPIQALLEISLLTVPLLWALWKKLRLSQELRRQQQREEQREEQEMNQEVRDYLEAAQTTRRLRSQSASPRQLNSLRERTQQIRENSSIRGSSLLRRPWRRKAKKQMDPPTPTLTVEEQEKLSQQEELTRTSQLNRQRLMNLQDKIMKWTWWIMVLYLMGVLSHPSIILQDVCGALGGCTGLLKALETSCKTLETTLEE
jgi:ABC-type multidrug transport system fused ATPase/permease subunit